MSRALDIVVRWRYAVVSAVFVLCALVGNQANGDLGFFSLALHVLGHAGSSGGLHLYAVHPDIQIGPVAIVAVGLLAGLCFGNIVLAVAVGTVVLLLAVLRMLETLARHEGAGAERTSLAILVGGMVLAASYAVVVPGSGHIDDLGALTAMVAALCAARRGRGGRTGLWLAIALGCKPWAVLAAALVLFLPSRQRRRALVVFSVVALLCWAPFVIAAPSSLSALSHFSIPATMGSLPLQLGYASAPWWIRPAQFVLATFLVLICVRRRRPDLVLLVVAVSRLALDAGVFPYYDAELVLACVVADVYASTFSRLSACAPTALLSWGAITLIHDEVFTSAGTLVGRCILYAALVGVCTWRGRSVRHSIGAVPGDRAVVSPRAAVSVLAD